MADYQLGHLHALKSPRTVILVFTVYFVATTIYSLLFHPLRKVPGPFLAKFSESWRSFRYFRGTWHDDIITLHRRYGPLVRIAPNEISFVDVEGLKALYGHGKQIKKTSWYDVWKIPGMTVSFFATTDFRIHRHLRSRVQGAYTTTSLLAMEPLLQDVLDTNWSKFEEFSRAEEVFRIDEWVNYFTFDVVGQLAMGGMIGFLDQGRDVSGIIRSIHDGFWMMANMGNMPLQMLWFNNRLIRGLTQALGIRRLHAFDDFVHWLDRRVEERMINGLNGRRRDMLQHFVEAKDEEKKPVKKADVMIEGVNILGAGADTTTIGILATLGALLKHKHYISLLQAEIDKAYEDLGLDQGGGHIQFTDAQKLPLLSAIIKESTRLHPSIQYQLPRYSPKEGVCIQQFFIPEGTVCGISPASMNRSQEVFGPDADHFRPERWISQGPEDEERIKYANTLLVTFGMGSRSCIGRNLALIEMHKYIAQFFRQFDAELASPEKPWVTKSQWFAFQRDFKIRIKLRQLQEARGQSSE